MSFFQPLPEIPEAEPEIHVQPPWAGPPPGWLAGVVASHHIVFHTDEASLSVGPFDAYPTGVLIRFRLTVRHPTGRLGDDLHDLFVRPHHRGSTSAGTLRVGMLLADGFRWDDAAGHRPPSGERHVGLHGGHGSESEAGQDLWLWPLPPPGPITFVTEWKHRGIDETRINVDAQAILEAAERAIELWPAD